MSSKKSKNEYRYVEIHEEVTVVSPVSKTPMQTLKVDAKGSPMRDDKGEPTNELIPDDPWDTFRTFLSFVFQKEGWDKPFSKQRVRKYVLDLLEDPDDLVEGVDGSVFLEVRGDHWQTVKDYIEDDDFSVPMPHSAQLMHMFESWLQAGTHNPSRDESTETKPANE